MTEREERMSELAQLDALLRKYRRNGEGFFLDEQHGGPLPTPEEFKEAALAIYRSLTFGCEFPPEDYDRLFQMTETMAPCGLPRLLILTGPSEDVAGVIFLASKDRGGSMHYWLVLMGGRVIQKVTSRVAQEYMAERGVALR